MTTYSFMDVTATIVGPGGTFGLSNGAGPAEEGITITPEGDKNVMTVGADGDTMTSLRAAKNGSIVVRLLKTSTVNQKLNLLYNLQTASSALNGLNVIVVANIQTGDVITCTGCSFKRHSPIGYAAVGGNNEWEFLVAKIEFLLGSGSPSK